MKNGLQTTRGLEAHQGLQIMKELKAHQGLLLMMVPGLLYYIIFCYGPMYGILIAFKEFKIMDGINASPWAGFKYFEMAFSTSEFWRVCKNTLIISGLKLIFSFPAPIILALLLNEVRNLMFKKTIQTLTYLPHFISWVVLAGVISNFLSPSMGPFNIILKSMDMKPIFFLGETQWFRPVLVFTTIWKEVGWGTIIYLAALTGVDTQLYEAASIDGAKKLRQVFSITLPSIMPIIIIMFIMAVGSIVNDDFDQIINLYSPAVYSVSDVISTYVYRTGLERAMYSYSTAIGLFKNVIAFMLVYTTNKITSKVSEYGLF